MERYRRDKVYRRRRRYWKAIQRAWPDWAQYADQYKAIYLERDRRRARGEDVEVDHIVPLNSSIVCGLHVPWNLQIISREENAQKSNHWWPDMPCQIDDLFCSVEFAQLQLPFN